jgi:hypothetical protein
MVRIKTLRQLETAWQELREEIASRAIFLDNAEGVKAERRERCADSVLEFARTYFPEYVSAAFAQFHHTWEQVRRIEGEPVLVEAFRGSGKSTFFTLLAPIHGLAYGKRNFMIFSSYNAEKSAAFMRRILLELMYNQRLKNDFGEFIEEGRKPSLRRFTVRLPGTGGKTALVRSISMGQDPRGFVHKAHQPDYVRLDDIQIGVNYIRLIDNFCSGLIELFPNFQV